MSTFLEITCPKEQAMYRRAGMLWLRAGYDPTDEYSRCEVAGGSIRKETEFQEDMMRGGWQYAILIEDDEGDD